MKLPTLVFLWTSLACAADWSEVQRLTPGARVEVTPESGPGSKASFVSASSETLVFEDKSGQHSLNKTQIKRVRVPNPSGRTKRGLLWTAIGAGTGAAVAGLSCPSCGNEGQGYSHVAIGAAVGAGLGALGFLGEPWRTIYRK